VSPQKILESLNGVSVGAEVTAEEEKLIMFVGASSEESTRKGLVRDDALGLSKMQLVICGNRSQLQQVAIEMQVRMMVVTGGFEVDPEMVKLAREKGVKIICCQHDTATTVQLIRCSRMVDTALGGEFLCVDADEAVSDVRRKLSVAKQEIFPVVEKGTRKLIGVFTKADLVAPPVTKIVMVDHNEYSQAVRGIEEAEVVEVIDHHRLGGNVVSREPIRFLNEPVGSSSTLIARKFRDRKAPLSKGVALCLSAGLISDTLNLTSPTTTDVDRGILKWLCEIAGVDAKQFTQDLFASGSLLHMGTANELIHTDRKEFEESGKHISITQIEEVRLDGFDDRRAEIEEELEKLCRYKGYDLAIAAVTDITKHVSLILAKGDERIISELPFEHRADGVIIAKDVVSRKKQIFPAVCQAICSARATIIE
jgi:manganese-dependent inorganic pyrophosphatase